MAENIPERLDWAVEKLALSGDETILEIGCGRGVAVALVCARLRGGTITAIDRCATAIEAAMKRNREHVAAGRAFFRETSIEAFDQGGARFDIVFAINVNLFWLDAAKGLVAVRRLLANGGRLHLFYEPPSADQAARIVKTLADKLAKSGFVVLDTQEAAIGRSTLLGVTARPGG
jgi:cyclopropane fatty-acyl-phospholipid synthase-like methyltransferase